MITPRRTRLVRVPDLHAFRRAIRVLSQRGEASSTFVIVPNRAAALRSTFITRDDLYEELHARVASAPRWLTPFEREAIAQSAADEAARTVRDLTFQVRPGLVSEMLRFYDHLRRQAQQVVRFEQLIEQALGADAAASDRGTERMLRQTQFLARTFIGYESRAAAYGWDEHLLRSRLMIDGVAQPVRHIVVTVPDWIADPQGLFVADFDLLARMPGIESIDVISTDAQLESGFHQRLHDWLPGIEEVNGEELIGDGDGARPALVVPQDAAPEQLWFVHRDREEELLAVARAVGRSHAESTFDVPTERRTSGRIGVVYKRPLPYLYLAPATLGAAGIAYSSSDAFPLAAEPTAAAVDLVLDAVEAGFAREGLIALLRSPHFRFSRDVSADAAAALNRFLSEQRYLGDALTLEALSVLGPPESAFRMSTDIAQQLRPMADSAPASVQLRHLRAFLTASWRDLADDEPFASRERRARAAILEVLDRLSEAHAAHHDAQWTIAELAHAVRRWIQEKTFAPEDESPADRLRQGYGGPPKLHAQAEAGRHVRLLDDQAARYWTFDDLFIVGMIENEWPERPKRNIFYPPALLKALGWPSERDRKAAADARLLDLVASATHQVSLSTFTLDEETLVTRSIQLDEIPRAGLSTVSARPDVPAFALRASDGSAEARVRSASEGGRGAPTFVGDAAVGPSLGSPFDRLRATLSAVEGSGDGPSRNWSAMRLARPPRDLPEFHGRAGVQRPKPWSVSALETYLDCPFKFFARHVLSLEEEPEDEEIMDPRRQGQLVHAVFEAFFTEWQAAGHGAITPHNLDAARAMFAAVVDRQLQSIPVAEAALERARLLGSSAASGLGEAVFRMEAERPIGVVERLLEHRVDGELLIAVSGGTRAVSLKGKADRIDLLADGTFRLIDYKLGWPPDRGRALQLPVYALSAERTLQGYRGRSWTLGEAAYLAFKGPRRVGPLFTSSSQRDEVLAGAQQRIADTIDAIERGDFPPAPDDVFRCDTCAFASVCRKDYVAS